MKKNILITGGPTWVSIDNIRVISNISTGSTGYAIAKYALNKAYNVTFLYGQGTVELEKNFVESIHLIKFKYYSELLYILKKLLASHNYHIIIHSAAVSDYIPEQTISGKIKSNIKNLNIVLKPAIKIVDKIKIWDPNIFLIKFKLECNISKLSLIDIGYKSLLASNADIVVANTYLDDKCKKIDTYIIDKNKNIIRVPSRNQLPQILFQEIDNL